MKKIVPILLLLAAAGGAAYWYYYRRPADDRLVLSGSIEARTVEVGSLVGGRVERVLVDEGATVTAGQPLVILEPDLSNLQVAQQRAAVAQSEANLARVAKGPRAEERRRAEIVWQAAETDRKRLASLWKDGVISRQQYDGAVVAESTARETLNEARRGGRSEDVAAARATLEGERQRLAFLERQEQELQVTAPAAGVIESMDLRPGDLVAPNQPVAEILETDQIWVRVYVPEPKLGLVQKGQPVTLTVDTFPHRAFRGQVVEIRHQAEYTPRNVQTIDQRSDQVFGVKVRIEPTPDLKVGMAALVHLQPEDVAGGKPVAESRR